MPTPQRPSTIADHLPRHPFDVEGKRPAVGVAQHDGRRARAGRGRHDRQREARVGGVPVEEVLCIEEHRPPLGHEEGDGILHHGDRLVGGRSQRFEDVVIPRFSDDAHGRGSGVDEALECRVALGTPADASGRPEGHEPRGLEFQLVGRAGEELVVLGIRPGPAALDPGHTQSVELRGDPQLVVHGERDPLELGSIAEGRVVDLDPRRRATDPSDVGQRAHAGSTHSE